MCEEQKIYFAPVIFKKIVISYGIFQQIIPTNLKFSLLQSTLNKS